MGFGEANKTSPCIPLEINGKIKGSGQSMMLNERGGATIVSSIASTLTDCQNGTLNYTGDTNADLCEEEQDLFFQDICITDGDNAEVGRHSAHISENGSDTNKSVNMIPHEEEVRYATENKLRMMIKRY
jgi:hypothetical protein